ncbi:hypothetical protein Fmac_023073 [Flemingia macrophylla]|uniref:Uncharacterized protein n=1 Tax=Flemingia macrophylla TaxID=520843 RepID=A0ABD1LKH5_9FABA
MLRSTATNATNPPLRELGGKDSPVASTSMVTPFVAWPGSNRVSRFMAHPATGVWKPWGRLKAWRDRDDSNDLGYLFELIPDTNSGMSAADIVLAEFMVCDVGKRGGRGEVQQIDGRGERAARKLHGRCSGICGGGHRRRSKYECLHAFLSTAEKELCQQVD